MDDQPKIRRDWSSLPDDLLLQVLQRLKNNETDCRRLRAVCTSWRSSLAPLTHTSLHFPRKIMPLRSFLDDLQLRQRIFYVISLPRESSSGGVWLTSVQESSSPNIWKLQNPMSYPSNLKSLQKRAQVNLLDHSISEVARSYFVSSGYMSRSVIFLPESEDNNGNFYLLTPIIQDFYDTIRSWILYNSREDKWVTLPTEVTHDVDDMVSYQGKFYANDSNGGLIAINPITFEVKEIIKQEEPKRDIWYPRNFDLNESYTYMLESCGRLYLVEKFILDYEYYKVLEKYDYGVHYNDEGVELGVYVLSPSFSSNGDIISHYWEPVTSLGDRVFFVGNCLNFSVSAQELAWEKGNCVIFTEENQTPPASYLFDDILSLESKIEHYKIMSSCFGVYTLEDRKILLEDNIPSEYVSLFWPVPSWLAAHFN